MKRRIAVSGAQSNLRTALAQRLAEDMNLTFLDGDTRQIRQARNAFVYSTTRQENSRSERQQFLEKWVDTQLEYSFRRNQKTLEVDEFVLDGWELDLFIDWLDELVDAQVDGSTAKLFGALKSFSQRIDFLVLPPLMPQQKNNSNPDLLTSTITQTKQLRHRALAWGLLRSLSTQTVIALPSHLVTLESQANFVARTISATERPNI